MFNYVKNFIVVFLFTFAFISNSSLVSAEKNHPQNATTVDHLILGGTIVTMDPVNSIIEEGGVAIKQGRIIAIGSRTEIKNLYNSNNIIDATDKVILPGLINGHAHTAMALFRGLADDLELQNWLTNYIFPAEARNVNEDFVRIGTRLGLAEMIKGGTTTFADMYYFEDAVAEETAKAGVRGVLGQGVMDFPAPDGKTFDEGMQIAEKYIEKWQGHDLIVPAIAPHSPYIVSKDHLIAVSELSKQTGAPILIHVSETKQEVERIEKEHGASPVTYLKNIGFLNNQVIIAHMVFPKAEEIDILKNSGAGVVHNPHSNMKLASGIAPVPEMLLADIPVGLGTDSAASNNDLNIWDEMDMAAKLHKVATGDPKAVTAKEALEMATIRGARALHLERDIGSLEVGKKADLIILDMDALHQTPCYNIYSNLVYATKASDVNTVVINGVVVMRDHTLLTLNEETIKEQARSYRDIVKKSLEKPSEK